MNFEYFPKVRAELSKEFQDIYEEYYKKNRDGASTATSMANRMERWLHRQVARDTLNNDELVTLELGAGTLNQLEYESTKVYDIVEPQDFFYKDSPYRDRVRDIFLDISEVPQKEQYDRVIAVACFEHICNLPDVVNATTKVLKPSGVLRVAIPNQGRFLWTFAYNMTTGREFRKTYGLDYNILMNYEHVNTADEIEEVVKYYYSDVKVKLFGVTKSLAFYRYLECHNPR